MNKQFQITDINTHKNNQKMVEIHIDHHLFAVTDYKTVAALNLYIGKIISQDVLETINYDSNLLSALNDAIQYISYRKRSEWEVKKKLSDKKYDNSIIEDAVNLLKERDIINDWDFSLKWIQYQINKKPAGRIRLENELFKKGIDNNTINNILDFYFENFKDEKELAEELIEKKELSLKSKNVEPEPHNIIRLLRRQGFSNSIIQAIYDKYKTSN